MYARRVRQAVESSLAPGGSQPGAAPAPRAFAAVAAAMQRQLHELDALLLKLHSRQPCPHPRASMARPGSNTNIASTLLWLEAETCGVVARLRLLDAVAAAAAAAAATAGGGSALSPAAAAAQLVDGLQALLTPHLLQGGPQGDLMMTRSIFDSN